MDQGAYSAVGRTRVAEETARTGDIQLARSSQLCAAREVHDVVAGDLGWSTEQLAVGSVHRWRREDDQMATLIQRRLKAMRHALGVDGVDQILHGRSSR